MAGTIVVDRIESDASYASTINVAGQITFSNTVNFGAFAGTAPVAGFYLPTTNNLAFTTASTERMRINNNGDVGIGTASPSTYSKLTVLGSSVSGFAGITSINGAGSSGSGGIQFGSDGTYVKSAIALVREQANGGGSLVFYNDSNADAANWDTTDEKMRIDFAGNVSMGTGGYNIVLDQVGAARPLVVQKSDSNTTVNGSTAAITVVNGNTTTNNSAQLNFAALTGASTNQMSSAVIGCIFGARTNGQYPIGQLTFSTSTALNVAPLEKMRLTNDGLLLLGDTSGSAKLEIASPNSPYDNAAIRLRAGTAGINFVQRISVFVSNAITWTTIVRITPSNLSQTWQRGLVTASIAGHTSGVNNGALSQAVYYFDNTDATRTCGVVSAGTGSGTGAPQFRTVMDSNTYVLQVQSSNATNRFDGVADITIICAGGAGGAQTFSISYS